MSRIMLSLLTVVSISGCSQFYGQMADCPCTDCVPPPVAGRYKYHRKLDNHITARTAQRCAHRDLKQVQSDWGPLSRDYRDGFTQAYIDLAVGRPACVPAVPPPKYWHAWHRSCAGRGDVEQWYEGYRYGLDLGVNGGVNDFNRIVPNLDGGCVSAAYVNPYATISPPNTVRPLNGQTISQVPGENAPVANAGPTVDPSAALRQQYSPEISGPGTPISGLPLDFPSSSINR